MTALEFFKAIKDIEAEIGPSNPFGTGVADALILAKSLMLIHTAKPDESTDYSRKIAHNRVTAILRILYQQPQTGQSI